MTNRVGAAGHPKILDANQVSEFVSLAQNHVPASIQLVPCPETQSAWFRESGVDFSNLEALLRKFFFAGAVFRCSIASSGRFTKEILDFSVPSGLSPQFQPAAMRRQVRGREMFCGKALWADYPRGGFKHSWLESVTLDLDACDGPLKIAIYEAVIAIQELAGESPSASAPLEVIVAVAPGASIRFDARAFANELTSDAKRSKLDTNFSIRLAKLSPDRYKRVQARVPFKIELSIVVSAPGGAAAEREVQALLDLIRPLLAGAAVPALLDDAVRKRIDIMQPLSHIPATKSPPSVQPNLDAFIVDRSSEAVVDALVAEAVSPGRSRSTAANATVAAPAHSPAKAQAEPIPQKQPCSGCRGKGKVGGILGIGAAVCPLCRGTGEQD